MDKSRLRCQLGYVLENSPFYLEKWRNAGIDLRSIPELDDLSILPLTDKDEILAEQKNHPPFGRFGRPKDIRSLRRVHITSGTTGTPFYIVLTENDIAATAEAGRRAFLCAGLTSEDLVIHCLNYCLWAGGLTDHLNLEATGATVIPFGVGNSRTLIETILHLKPTAISCTPSYLSRLERLLREDFALEPSSLGLLKAFLGGEGGLQSPGVRARIEETWRIKAIDANYGMADVLSIFGSECEARQGLHYHGQGLLYLELINPGSERNLPIEDGQTGEMVLTNLRREAQPLVRYRSRDLIRIVSTQKCLCGRKSLRFMVVGRTDDMFVVRGINVFPNALANLLNEQSCWFSGEFELVLEGLPPYDHVLLRAELARGVGVEKSPGLTSALVQKCKDQMGFTPRLELIGFGGFPRTEGKTKRIRKS